MTPPASAGHASDVALALYALDPQEVDPATADHVAQCRTCQGEIAAYGGLLEELEAQVYRVTCPPAAMLTAYAQSRLAPGDRQGFEAHLVGCRRCAEELRATRAFLERSAADLAAWTTPASTDTAIAPAAAGPMDALRRILAQLLPNPSAGNPAFSVLGPLDEGRGPGLHVYRAEGVTITVQQENDLGAHVVTGSVRQDAEARAGGQALLVRLLRASASATDAGPYTVLESTLTRDTFEFEGVPDGEYQLEVLFPDRIVVVAPVRVDVAS